MLTRSKLIAAVLGVVVAAGAVGDASAATIIKTVRHHAPLARTVNVVAHHPRLRVGTRAVKIIRVAHRAPILAVKKVVRVTRRPILVKQAFEHRVLVKKTVIR